MKRIRVLREIHAFLLRFVVIYGFTMLFTLVFMLIFNRDGSVDWHYFAWCVLFSFAGDFTSLAYLSSHELTEKQWRFRTIISIILSEIVLMPLGYQWMWTGWAGAALFFLAILAVDIGVRTIGYGVDVHTANELNELIRKKRSEQRKREAEKENYDG